LNRLAPDVHDRIVEALQKLARNPHPTGCRKLAGTENDWRIRVGDYRVIYEIADAVREVRVHRVRHRREVYR
jgi:mRNA interferase RelE/StbE